MSAEENKNIQINLKEILFTIFNKWYIFAIIFVVCTISSIFYSYFIVTPLYDSTGKIYIMNKNSQTINTSDYSISYYMTKDYEELIVDKAVLNEVSKEIDYKYSPSQLKGMISINNPENTRFIEITVRSANAKDSRKIVNSLCEVSKEKIVDLLGIDRVNIIRKGELASSPSVPDVDKNIFNSLIVALVISIIAFFIIYFLNDKINSSEDVEKYLELNVLGNIPYNQSKSKK